MSILSEFLTQHGAFCVRPVKKISGFSIIELLIASTMATLLSVALLKIYLTQIQTQTTDQTQSLMQNAENAIENLIVPLIQNTGFLGCSSIRTVVSELNPGASKPIGTLNTLPAMMMGYDGGSSGITISTNNPANSTNGSDWSPALETGLIGNVQKWSDVLVILGPPVGAFPVSIISIPGSSSTFTLSGLYGMTITKGGFGAVSDCAKSSLFQITNSTASSITHTAGSGSYGNQSDTFSVNYYEPGSQFIPIQQTAFFVAHGSDAKSNLMMGVFSASGWTIQPVIADIALMKVRYGIGQNGIVTQYVTAGQVTDWSRVYAVKIGLLYEGDPGSASNTGNPARINVLDFSVNVPTDNRLRRSTEVTVPLRNATL